MKSGPLIFIGVLKRLRTMHRHYVLGSLTGSRLDDWTGRWLDPMRGQFSCPETTDAPQVGRASWTNCFNEVGPVHAFFQQAMQ